MRILLFIGLAAFLGSGFGAMASAQNYALRVTQSEAEIELAYEADYAGDVCGVSLSSSIDWSAYSDQWAHPKDVTQACDAALNALQTVCAADTAKAAIQDQLNSFSCAPGAASSISLAGGDLDFTVAPDADGYDLALGYLETAIN